MTEFAEHTTRRMTSLESGAIPPDVEFVVEQQVTDGDVVIDHFHVHFSGGRAVVVLGAAPKADVVLRQDVETARALQAGKIHAQRAFLTGRLSIDGDMDALLAHGPLLSSLLRGRDA